MGETLQPEEVEAMLGLHATRTHRKGDRRGDRNDAVWRESLWSLESPQGKDRDLPEHLDWLLDALEPKLDVLRSFSVKYRVDLFCGFSSGTGQGGFALDHDRLSRIAKLGVPIVFDLYPPDSE
jgi:hypothetical protein